MIRTIIAIVLFTELLSAVPAVAEAQPDRTWLALGDSYSAGEGMLETPPAFSTTLRRDCRRATGEGTSAVAWAIGAQRIAGRDLRLRKPDFVACTGATTDEAPLQIKEARDEALLAGRPGKWDLVTFSFGGNNIKFTEVIQDCIGLLRSVEDLQRGCVENEEQLRGRVDMLVGKKASTIASSRTG